MINSSYYFIGRNDFRIHDCFRSVDTSQKYVGFLPEVCGLEEKDLKGSRDFNLSALGIVF